MLAIYRRHLRSCPHAAKGRAYTKCSCPIWVDGILDGGRHLRRSLRTGNWQRAIRKANALEDPNAPRTKPIAEAITSYENSIQGLEPSTQRKYKNVLRQFRAFCDQEEMDDLEDCTVERLDAFRAGRKLARTTAQKELETLRQFFAFCFDRRWIGENPAKRIRSARNVKPAEVVPYTTEEVARIIAACDAIGRAPYERLRGRAMVLLLNNTALRVSDIATLARGRIMGDRVLLRTLKTGDLVSLPLWAETKTALDALPIPRGTVGSAGYFFWNGATSRRAVVGIAERTLAAVFKKSGVPGAHAHRFRHTLATRLLGMGATEQEVADILGNSAAIVRKHYAKWSQARQRRIDELMQVSQIGTPDVHKEKRPVIH
ncbi:MAG TPA: tyrosine-type recombinase/integrase [Edaphobacter sp.]|nr:tyrosine-type recombinase/integrase [Edaphobacter sp.]